MCEREARSRNKKSITSNSEVVTTSHCFQEREWLPIRRGKVGYIPLTICWDPSGVYCAEGNNKGDITVWNCADNTTPYNTFDRSGSVSFRAADSDPNQHQNIKSTCIAWTDTAHYIFMATNFDVHVSTLGSEFCGDDCPLSRISYWSMTGDVSPVCTKR